VRGVGSTRPNASFRLPGQRHSEGYDAAARRKSLDREVVYLDVLVEWPTAFAEVLAVMSAAIKPDDPECPVCKAHRAKEAERQRRHRANKAKKVKAPGRRVERRLAA
jgi:adenine-specific DNA glycosylase